MRIDHVRSYVLEALPFVFHPRRIAVIGASRHPGKLGYEVIRSLRDRGYPGEILPVNPHATEVNGLRAYPSIRDVAGEIDLAFLALPDSLVESAIADCAAQGGVKAAAITASGFKERGDASVQDQITRFCRAHQLPLFGPNLLALGNPHFPFSCGATPYDPTPGPVAVISQSGANLLAALGAGCAQSFGISLFAGLGNKADIDYSELIVYAGQDSNTRSLALYMEGIDSPEAFLESCRAVAPRKPIVALKAGGSELGGRAAMAHTASESGAADDYYDRLFQEAGVIRVRTLQELLDVSFALALMPAPAGDNFVVVTNGGGSGLLATDEFERRGIALRELSSLSPELGRRIAECMPRFGSHLNPIDLGATASAADYSDVAGCLLRDRAIDGVLVSVCPTSITRIPEIAHAMIEVGQEAKGRHKPLIVQLQGGADCDEAIHRLRAGGIPAYAMPESAVTAMTALRAYSALRERTVGKSSVQYSASEKTPYRELSPSTAVKCSDAIALVGSDAAPANGRPLAHHRIRRSH